MSRLLSKILLIGAATVILLLTFVTYSDSISRQVPIGDLSAIKHDVLHGAVDQKTGFAPEPGHSSAPTSGQDITPNPPKKEEEASKPEKADKKEKEAPQGGTPSNDQQHSGDSPGHKKTAAEVAPFNERMDIGSFTIPKHISYNPDGPTPDKIVMLAASDGKGHNNGIENLLDDIRRNREEYANYHGYNFQFINITKYDLRGAHAVWAKLPAIIEAFNTHPAAEWVWWLDTDAYIMTPTVELNSHLLKPSKLKERLLKGVEYSLVDSVRTGRFTPKEPDVSNIDLIIAQDQNGVNAGSFFLRRSEFTQMLLEWWSDPIIMKQDWVGEEQDALSHLIVTHPFVREHVGVVTQNVINAYPITSNRDMGWWEGDLLVHLAGCWVENKCDSQWKEYKAKSTKAPKKPSRR